MRHAFMFLAVPFVLVGCAAQPTPQALNMTSDNMNVADAALAGGDPTMALQVAQSVLENYPHNPDALVHEGDAFYALGRIPDAAAAYQAALAAEPRSAPAEIGIGRTKLRTDAKAAVSAFSLAIAYDPGNAAAYNDLGIALALQGDFGNAIAAYRKALVAQPGLVPAEVNLGLTLALAGRTDLALQYLGPLATGSGSNPKIREDYATALVLAGREADARTVLAADSPASKINDEINAIRALAANALASQERAMLPVSAASATAASDPVASVQAQALPVVQTATPAPTPAQNVPSPPVQHAALTQAPPEPVTPPATTQAAGSMVQLGALNSEAAATRAWAKLVDQMPQLFSGRQLVIVPAVVDGHDYFRMRTAGFASRTDAESFCGEVIAHGGTCEVAF
jgi:Flp pilus assembly protein TadD